MSRAGLVNRACDEPGDRSELVQVGAKKGLLSRAGSAKRHVTRKNLSPVSRDPGAAIPGSRLTGVVM